MTDFTLSSGSICRPLRSPWGNFPTRHFGVCSSAARIDIGRPVTLNWSANSSDVGLIIPSSADTTFYLVGVAASSLATSSTGVANPLIPVWEANPMVEFKAITKGAVLKSSNIGLRKKLVWDSTLNVAWVDLTASTATDWRVVVTGLIDAEGDSGGYVSFRFIDHTADQINSTICSTTPLLAFYS